MRKALSLILAFVLCVCLCACDTGTDVANPTNDEMNNLNPNDGTSTNGTTENTNSATEKTEKHLIEILCADDWYPINDCLGCLVFNEEDFEAGGRCSIEGDTLAVYDGITKEWSQYEIELISNSYFLIGSNYTYTYRPAEIVKKTVKLTIDNWQEFFEFGSPDSNGNCTLKVKATYHKISCYRFWDLTIKYSNGNGVIEEHYDYAFGSAVITTNFNPESFEMVEIQGTLYFVDGL